MTFKRIGEGDPLFSMYDGLTICKRAAIEVDKKCPTNFYNQLINAINAGWIKPVAYMREEEYTWESLKE